MLRNVDPLYIHYSNGMEVLGKRLTKAVSESCEQLHIVGNEHNRSVNRGMQLL